MRRYALLGLALVGMLACSAEQTNHIGYRRAASTDGGTTNGEAPGKPDTDTPPGPAPADDAPPSDADGGGTAAATDAGARVDGGGGALASAACQANDTQEIKGQVTPFTKAACGELSSTTDEDDFSFDVAAAATITFRFAAEADAVAKVTTPAGDTKSVTNGGSATIDATAGTIAINVTSPGGKVQTYRMTIE